MECIVLERQGFAVGPARGLFHQGGWLGFPFVRIDPGDQAQIGPPAIGSGAIVRSRALGVGGGDFQIDLGRL